MEDLPREIVELVIRRANPFVVYLLSMTNQFYYTLCLSDRVWKSMYKRTLPMTYEALQLLPLPTYWDYNDLGVRRFVAEAAKLEVETDDELKLVMSVMNGHLQSLSIQLTSAYIIRRLAFFPEGCQPEYVSRVEKNREKLGEMGTVDSLFRSLASFPDNSEITAAIFCSLGNLAIQTSNVCHLVGRIEEMVSIMGNFLGNTQVVDSACFALCNISGDFSGYNGICQSSVLSVILNQLSLPTFGEEKEVQALLDLLTILSQQASIKVEHGLCILDIIKKTMEKYSKSNEFILLHSLTIFMLICDGNQRNVDQAIATGFLPMLYDVLELEGEDPTTWSKMKWEIQERSVMCFYTLLIVNDASEMKEHRLNICRFVLTMLQSCTVPKRIRKPYAAFVCEFVKCHPSLKSSLRKIEGVAQLLLGIVAEDTEYAYVWDTHWLH
eukprot:TRINITY_DN9343_c0_g1_i1.p1 TRINITY_DN9343_c0_g1~~TRINITY_DN9343_c0_g1_i1.p1  ORF type:complete len:453 (-),score=37.49 TRINITY_DN9343_c0_g1_i1:33-1346(-)